jgi:hypothetical protein
MKIKAIKNLTLRHLERHVGDFFRFLTIPSKPGSETSGSRIKLFLKEKHYTHNCLAEKTELCMCIHKVKLEETGF